MVNGKIGIPDAKIRVDFDSFPGFRDRFLVLTRGFVIYRQTYVRLWVTGIGPRPRLTGLARLFQISGYQRLVAGRDREFLPITHAIPQLPGPADAFRRQIRLIE